MLNLPETRMLIERLAVDQTLRRLCGWERARQVPCEATFSRAFAELAEGAVATRMHAALVKRTLGQKLVGHIAIDATAIAAREKPIKAEKPPAKPKRKKGRPKKGEVAPPKEPRMLTSAHVHDSQVAIPLAKITAAF